MQKKVSLIAALCLAGLVSSCAESDDADRECKSNAKKCQDNRVMVCSPAGVWMTGEMCVGATPICDSEYVRCTGAQASEPECTPSNVMSVCKRANASAVCSASGTCKFACNSGYEDKDGVCTAKDALAASPSTECTPDNAAEVCKRDHASAVCSEAGKCVYACLDGFEEKDGVCAAVEASECAAAEDCQTRVPDNAEAVCNDGKCGFICQKGYKISSDGTACTAISTAPTSFPFSFSIEYSSMKSESGGIYCQDYPDCAGKAWKATEDAMGYLKTMHIDVLPAGGSIQTYDAGYFTVDRATENTEPDAQGVYTGRQIQFRTGQKVSAADTAAIRVSISLRNNNKTDKTAGPQKAAIYLYDGESFLAKSPELKLEGGTEGRVYTQDIAFEKDIESLNVRIAGYEAASNSALYIYSPIRIEKVAK